MTVQFSATALQDGTPVPAGTGEGLARAAVSAMVERAATLVAPLWPLDRFVAVNPFLGLADRTFADASAELGRIGRARTLMPTAFYAGLIEAGRISDGDLDAALASQRGLPGLPASAAAVRDLLQRGEDVPAPAGVLTLSEAADAVHGTHWSRSAVEAVSRACAAHADAGQAAWASPWRDQPLYAAWREAAAFDRSPELAGLAGFRPFVAGLPADPLDAIARLVEALGVSEQSAQDYLSRALWTVRGWASFWRQRAWTGGADDGGASLADLLAIRLAWDAAVLASCGTPQVRRAWRAGLSPAPSALAGPDVRLVLQAAFERSLQRETIMKLAGAGGRPEAAARPDVQAVFCIDVRSEVMRRALEGVAPSVETLGFAGFFGFAVAHVPFGARAGTPQCPVLLSPRQIVCESVPGEGASGKVAAQRRDRLRLGRIWDAFKGAAVSGFPFVEAAGIGHAAALAAASLGATQPAPELRAGLGAREAAAMRPDLQPGTLAGATTGLSLADRIAAAEGALRGMSLAQGFARLVLLCAHGSSSVNNPHRAGLDCGACGGQDGTPNARIAAGVLNQPEVRQGLADRGIVIPDDTWFLAGRHDTTTDEISLFDLAALPSTHAADLARLQGWLAEAGAVVRAIRAPSLGLAGAAPSAAVARRARDWSQVRPEWGLAGNTSFIAAPRAVTRGLDLGGRAFLHSYDPERDESGAVLELIMTAPMVVASWINLQYYASTVDNAAFGAGDKTLHNVTGTFGVLEGRGGDLRAGLPWQSVHDGTRLVHEPARLSVYIAAQPEAMNAVIARHAHVRHLVDHGWVHLFALGPDGRVAARYAGGLTWKGVEG